MAADTFASMVRPQLEQLRRMFPIGSNQHAFVPLPRSGPGTSAAPSQASSDAVTSAQEDSLRDTVVQGLRGDDPVDGPIRHIVLETISTMAYWPPGLAIQLHVAGGDSATTTLYGAPAEGMQTSEPLQVKQSPDGGYAAATLNDQWIDCGAHADSLFEAVLVALKQRDNVDHRTFTWACMLHSKNGGADAQVLRECVAEAIEQGAALDAGAMQAPAPLPQPASMDDRVPQTSHRDAVVQWLRGHDALDRQTLEAALTAVTTLPGWPAGVQIQLQVASVHATTTMRTYGAAADSEPPLEPVRVRQSSDGHYMAADRGDEWIDCGAQANSLFEAVLVALLKRDEVDHVALTVACTLKGERWGTPEAQLLRESVADAIAQGGASDAVVLQAPAPLPQFATSSNITIKSKRRIPGNNTVTVDMVLQFSKMDQARRQRGGGLGGFAKLNLVTPHALNNYVLADGTLTTRGERLVQRTPSGVRGNPVTRDLLARYRQAGIRTDLGQDQFAIMHGVSPRTLRRYTLVDGTLTLRGQELFQRDRSGGPPNPVTSELLQALMRMSQTDFNSAGGLAGIAATGRYSYASLEHHMNADRELNDWGRDLIRRGTSDVPCNPVTPELVLQLSRMSTADFKHAGGRPGFAAKHHLSLPSLAHYVLIDGRLTSRGDALVLRATST